jgi:hypothetical protein
MSITASRLRQIVKEEVQRAKTLTEGYPNTMGYRGSRHYDSPMGGRRPTQGGRDEAEYGPMGDEFMQQWSKGDMVMTGDGSMATVVGASEVDSAVRIRFEDGRVMTIDGDYLERA